MGTAVANRIEENPILTAFGHVLRLPLRFLASAQAARLTKQIDQSDQVAPIVLAFAKDIAPEAMRIVGALAIMLAESPPLTGIALLTIQPICSLRGVQRKTGHLFHRVLWTVGRGVCAYSRRTHCNQNRKIERRRDSGSERLHTVSDAAYNSYLQRNRLTNRYLFWQTLLAQVGKALVLSYGGLRVFKRQLTPGDVVMFVAYLDKLYDPIDWLTSQAKTLQQHLSSLKRALRLREIWMVKIGVLHLCPDLVEWSLRTYISATRRDARCYVASTTLEPGKVTALVGPSGAKDDDCRSSVALIRPTTGTITIDGRARAYRSSLSATGCECCRR